LTFTQNPPDPDATYRSKAGKEHRGYTANITEAVDQNGSVVVDYQYDVNTNNDKEFLDEVIEKSEPSEDVTTIIADGAYSSEELSAKEGDKNIAILTTNSLRRNLREILADFSLTEDVLHISSCSDGHEPKSSSYIWQTDSIRASFPRSCCENCSHKEECLAHIKTRTATVNIPLTSRAHAISSQDKEAVALKVRIRNGVEIILSILRRKYHVDDIPVRGKLKTKIRFGFKLLALFFSILWLYTKGLEKCRTYE
jgi:hypothetical protein